MKETLTKLLEGKKEIEPDPYYQTDNEIVYKDQIRARAFNQGIDTAIEAIPEMLEIVRNELETQFNKEQNESDFESMVVGVDWINENLK